MYARWYGYALLLGGTACASSVARGPLIGADIQQGPEIGAESSAEKISICLVDGSQITMVEATYNPLVRDTVVDAQWLALYTATLKQPLADNRGWYHADAPLLINDHRYIKAGSPRFVSAPLEAAGSYDAVPLFTHASTGDNLYFVPLRSDACIFQTYQMHVQIPESPQDADSASTNGPEDKRRTPHADLQEPTVTDSRSIRSLPQLPLGVTIAASATFKGTLQTEMPQRMRQGRPYLVVVSIFQSPPSRRGRFIEVRREAVSDESPAAEQHEVQIFVDSITATRLMRVRLSGDGDSTMGYSFRIVNHHSDETQHVLPHTPAKWTFRITPLKAGPQKLYITADMLVEENRGDLPSSLGTTVRHIIVDVDHWWSVKRFLYQHIIPVLAVSILIPGGSYLLKRFLEQPIRTNREANEQPPR